MEALWCNFGEVIKNKYFLGFFGEIKKKTFGPLFRTHGIIKQFLNFCFASGKPSSLIGWIREEYFAKLNILLRWKKKK